MTVAIGTIRRGVMRVSKPAKKIIANIIHGDDIRDYLIANQEFLNGCCKNLKTTRKYCIERHSEFRDIINKQFLEMVQSTIIHHVTNALAIPAEDVILVLEEIDLKEYLK